MSRNRYANKARNEARIHGQTLRGKQKHDCSPQVTRLIMAGRDDQTRDLMAATKYIPDNE
ncbi:hypothetical protein [Prochlorococcus marinus]|uniref:hypothetical protein n=1 Tax=Prochlorococcus TaxID=1218 RepID=UPI0007B3972A|nr:hypothetical protein [Prochlorococcus marinus]KZR72718.1 hypothetical protein PMIT1312_00033 [Prochlorococcus marinus str. MIT 1312]